MIRVEISKKHGEGLYKFIRRNSLNLDLSEMVRIINSYTIEEAAKKLNMDSIQLLIFIGHLKRANIVKEVRIR